MNIPKRLLLRKRNISIVLYITTVMIFVSACTQADQNITDSPADQTNINQILQQIEPSPGLFPHIDPWSVSGAITIAGSSTVFPLAERMAERFQDEGFLGNITVDSIGSGAGFERFCVTGESDIANASRPIKNSEIKACEDIGRSPIEFRVGTDALSVVVSQENEFLEDLSIEELALVFSTAETWSDVNPLWPNQEIKRFTPGTDSGTFDFFVEVIFDKNKVPILSANNIQFSEDDNVLVQGILGSPYAIGYFGYAYYLENADSLTLISIDGIEAIEDNINNSIYPLSRPLFIYADQSTIVAKPQVAAFINFFLTYVNEEVAEVGYFSVSTDALIKSKQKWLDAVG